MSISSQLSNNTLTISISGRFDFSIHREFRAAIDAVDGQVQHVNVDMRTTEYLDSSALGMLLLLKSKMNDRKDAVSLINAKPDVKKILEIANFSQLFTLN